ncbi:MAG: phospholipase D-like domain-containing protein [Patescibacteria group bacterium]
MQETLWKLYTSNTEAWEAMLSACRDAKESIELEQFIFVSDDFSKQLIDVCAERAQAGVKVRFIWDAAGSFSFFGSGIAENLKKRGVELVFFKTLLPSFLKVHDYRSWFFRNHRRNLVVDGMVGFTGSICVSEKMQSWRDSNVRLAGPVVHDMQRSFERMWDRAQGKKLRKVKKLIQSDPEFAYVTNNPLPRGRFLYHQVTTALTSAQKYICITTPYFVPTRRLARVLKAAAERGVDVKIILPKETDHPVVDMCSKTFFNSLLSSGVKIYLYEGEILHAKTLIIDGTWSTIGTQNLDSISLLYNFEANIISTNKVFAEELTSHFMEDLKHTQEVTLAEWKRRYWVEKFAGFFLRFVRDLL